jgi:hypothetical protein
MINKNVQTIFLFGAFGTQDQQRNDFSSAFILVYSLCYDRFSELYEHASENRGENQKNEEKPRNCDASAQKQHGASKN